MPPSAEEDLAQGLRLTVSDGGRVNLRRTFFCYDLEGDNPVEVFASALAIEPVPAYGEAIVIEAITQTLFVNGFDVEPWPPNDAIVYVSYGDRRPPATGDEFGKCYLSGGTALRMGETDFDAENLAKPFDERQTIYVPYNAASDGAAGGDAEEVDVRVPILIQDSAVTFTRYERSNPSARSRQFSGKLNSEEWFGLEEHSVLCGPITFNQVAVGMWEVSYTFTYDPINYHNQVARYTKPDGTFPKLTANQVAHSNGIVVVETQLSEDFNALNLEIEDGV